jgi:anaerobic ribonucleoside-triphosphate reductase activating protein
MKVELNKAHYPVTTLGPDRRVGIWFQGCSIGCSGCISQDTWAPDPSSALEIQDLVSWCKSIVDTGFGGISITGGEPFEQPDALDELLDSLIRWRLDSGNEFDILCYSGMSIKRLRKNFGSILEKVDAAITGPFVASAAPGGAWRGSSNQEVVSITQLGLKRYDTAAQKIASERPQIQVSVDRERIWYIGVPRPDDLEKLRTAASNRGIKQSKVSWLP